MLQFSVKEEPLKVAAYL